MLKRFLMILALLPGAALAQTELLDGIPTEGLSGDANTTSTYYLDVPAGTTNLGFSMEQGSGLANMFVNHGSASTDPNTVDCSDTESCEFTNPQAGRWYVVVFGVSDYANAALTGWSLTRVQKDDTVVGLAGDADSYRWFFLTVPGGTEALTATTSGGTGNVSLFVVNANDWQDILHGTGGTLCASDEDPGNAEACERGDPRPGTWLVAVYGETAYTGVTLEVDYEEGSGGAPAPMLLAGLLFAALVRRLTPR